MNKPVLPMLIAGETLVDMMVRPDGLIDPKLGGSPYNFALALARLGCTVGYVNPLSVDTFGQQLQATLSEASVAVRSERSLRPTSLACVTVNEQGQPRYSFYREGVADRDWDPLSLLSENTTLPGGYFHVGSLVLIPPDGAVWGQVLAGMRAKGMVTSVDVNMRLIAAPDHPTYIETVRSLMGHANILKVSDEDLKDLQMHGDPLAVARGLLNDTTRLVVLTLGEKGAWAMTAAQAIFQAPVNVNVVDTVGAGDCFYAGLTCALADAGALAGCDGRADPDAAVLRRALAFANQVTSFNLQQRGCVPPWREQLEVKALADMPV
jgi:fructokinase